MKTFEEPPSQHFVAKIKGENTLVPEPKGSQSGNRRFVVGTN